MGDEKTSTRALTGDRILSKPISNYLGGIDPGTGELIQMNDWQSAPGILYVEDYFDLSGYELDDLTLVPKYIRLQDGLPYYTNGEALYVFDIISQERLTLFPDFINYTLAGDYPSSKGSTEDWSQILFCNTRFFTPQVDFTFADLVLPATAGSFGSLEPTAASKLWIYRVVIPRALPPEGSILNIPASRFILSAEIVKEDDLDYMMRLKRSFELTNY